MMKRQNPNKELLTACRDATLTQVQMHTLLQKKADINTRDSKHKDSALMVAIKSGSLKTCQILVQFKADVNFQNWHQFYVTPLHLAIKEDHYSIARFLLQSPEFTDPDILDRYNETPLHRSSRMNNALIVRQLIEARCDLDKQNRDTKATALHIAAQEDNCEVARILLDSKASVMFNKSFKTPLDVALARSGDKKLITLLQQQNNQIDIQAERGSMDYRSRESCASGYDNGSDDDSDQGSRAKKRKTEKGKEQKKKVNKNAAQGKLMSALEAGSLSEKTLKKWIVSKAVDLNAFKKSSHRDAPLCLAVRSGRVSLVKLLLKHNADVNFRGQNYYPIHIAAMHKQQTIFNSLIEHKANIHLLDVGGESALVKAARSGDATITRALVERKCNPDVMNHSGTTALVAAVRGGVPDVVELLLKSRANPRLGSAYGKNPFDTAESKGMTEILELFKRYGCRASSAAHDDAGANSDLVEENDEAGIDKLCRKLEGAQKTMGRGKGRGGREKEQQQEKEKNIDADVGNANDLLLLHCGRNTLTEAVLLELLMSGCSIDAVSKEGNSALMIGMKSDSTLHTTRLLTSYGADVNFSAGGRRETPLQYAAREGKQDLVRLLLSKKADVNAQAIHCAAFHGRAGVIQLLLAYKADPFFVRNEHKQTAYEVAVQRKKTQVIALLEQYQSNAERQAREMAASALATSNSPSSSSSSSSSLSSSSSSSSSSPVGKKRKRTAHEEEREGEREEERKALENLVRENTCMRSELDSVRVELRQLKERLGRVEQEKSDKMKEMETSLDEIKEALFKVFQD